MLLHDLGEMLLVSRANVTGLMNHLEAKSLVKRVVDAKDRRARFAHITEKAVALLDRLVPVHFHNCAAMLDHFPNGDKQDLVRLLKKLRGGIQEHSELCERQAVTSK